MIDAVDRSLINALQGGFPLSERPYAEVGAMLGLGEADVIRRLGSLLENGTLSRFGPMFNADRMGGAFSLCALAVPPERFDEVTARVNAHKEVAHNYERRHALNMWFVLAADAPSRIDAVLTEIKSETGLEPYAFPKLEEYFVGMKVEA